MTDDEAVEIYNNMVAEFGDKLPSMEHYPIQFKYYYKLYKWTKEKNETNNKTVGDASQDTDVQRA